MDTLSREVTLLKLFCLPSEKGPTLKGKKLRICSLLVPRVGANTVFLE